MAELKFASFLVIQTSTYKNLRGLSRPNVSDTFEMSGSVILPMDTAVPVICPGTGCVGLADIKEITLKSSGLTRVTFTLKPISKNMAEAAYALYNNTTVANSSYDDEDMTAPGMYRGSTKVNKKSGGSLFDFNNRDDDDDDDDAPYHPRRF